MIKDKYRAELEEYNVPDRYIALMGQEIERLGKDEWFRKNL